MQGVNRRNFLAATAACGLATMIPGAAKATQWPGEPVPMRFEGGRWIRKDLGVATTGGRHFAYSNLNNKELRETGIRQVIGGLCFIVPQKNRLAVLSEIRKLLEQSYYLDKDWPGRTTMYVSFDEATERHSVWFCHHDIKRVTYIC